MTASPSDVRAAIRDQAPIMYKLHTPPGVIWPFAGLETAVPDGFLLCDGSEKLIVAYARLYRVIGLTYGAPSATAYFKLPDLRGRVIVAPDAMGGSAAGRMAVHATALGNGAGVETYKLHAAESGLPAHSHGVTDPGHSHGTGNGQQFATAPNAYATAAGGSTAATVASLVASTASATTGISINSSPNVDASLAHENVQPYIALNYIIAV